MLVEAEEQQSAATHEEAEVEAAAELRQARREAAVRKERRMVVEHESAVQRHKAWCAAVVLVEAAVAWAACVAVLETAVAHTTEATHILHDFYQLELEAEELARPMPGRRACGIDG